MRNKLFIGISPCPNDTFIFDALLNNKIENELFDFELIIEDVEDLNKLVLENKLDVSKISFHTYFKINDYYQILNSGAALGFNNGPILISKRKIYPDELQDVKIAIPGKNTTANLLLSIFNPKITNKVEYLFSDIEEAILTNEIDAGLIIHESRFTYESKGLKKIIDLGEYWQKLTNNPIPLGGIVVNRNLNPQIKHQIDSLIRKSIEYAFANPLESIPFIKKYAQELSSEVIQKHIDLYVNNFSIDLGEKGQGAIKNLFNFAIDKKLYSPFKKDIFIK